MYLFSQFACGMTAMTAAIKIVGCGRGCTVCTLHHESFSNVGARVTLKRARIICVSTLCCLLCVLRRTVCCNAMLCSEPSAERPCQLHESPSACRHSLGNSRQGSGTCRIQTWDTHLVADVAVASW